MGNSASANLPALQTVQCETAKFMGTWFVIGVKPTMFEKTCSNAVENYSLLEDDKDKDHDIDIDFKYNKDDPIKSALNSMPQKGWVQGDNKKNSGKWKVSPFPMIKMPYLILEVDDKYDYCIIGYPSRDYVWIMSRKPKMPEKTYSMLTQKLVEKHQYNLDGLRKVPQVWTRDEREKRGLTKKEIPDDMLVD
jgi:apolipoprotein D and lipocalin family protein